MSQGIQIATIAALAAVFGAVVSQITTFAISVWDKKHQKKVLLRQKYEEMALMYSESLLWFQRVSSSTTIEELHERAHNYEARKAYILCQIYFPKLQHVASGYVNASCSYYDSLVKEFDPSINVSALLQAQTRPEHEVVGNKIGEARQSFDVSIQKYAEEYTKA